MFSVIYASQLGKLKFNPTLSLEGAPVDKMLTKPTVNMAVSPQ